MVISSKAEDFWTLGKGKTSKPFKAIVESDKGITFFVGESGVEEFISDEQIEKMLDHFREKEDFPLGNTVDDVKKGGLGEYLKEVLGKDPRLASHLAAVLVAQGRLKHRFAGNSIILRLVAIGKVNQWKLEKSFEIAIDMYKFEMEMYWKRAIYFSTVIGVLATGAFSLFEKKNYLVIVILSILGIFVSILWLFANKASKFWVKNWFHQTELINEKLTERRLVLFGVVYVDKAFKGLTKLVDPGASYPLSVARLNHNMSFLVLLSWCIVFTWTWFKTLENCLNSPLREVFFIMGILCVLGGIAVMVLFSRLGDLKKHPEKFIPMAGENK